MSTNRSIILDFLKGLAIVAVVLYHFGAWFPYGYLGVDLFFVISGYLLVKGLSKQFEAKTFNYWSFIFKKAVRLWPLILLVSAVAVVIGYFTMLPDNYENLAESAVASTLFANNVLQAITTKNYWDVVNLYKPLMHMWYVDVLMQAYVILPLLYLLFVKLLKNTKKGLLIAGIAMSVISLVLFLLPLPTEWKFYYLPFRVFELSAGGLIALTAKEISRKKAFGIIAVSLLVILLMMCSRVAIVSPAFMLLAIVAATSAVVFAGNNMQIQNRIFNAFANFFAALGKRSYSIYIWHQFVIAFLFYSVFPNQDAVSFSVFLIVTILLSEISYRFIESKSDKFLSLVRSKLYFAIFNLVFAALVCGVSFAIYLNAGVVRDVPELNVSKDNVKRGMHKEYTDRIKRRKVGFEDSAKKHILVFGNSFGRDWTNILLEYDKENSLEVTWLVNTEESAKKYASLIEKADMVFYAEGPSYVGVPEYMSNAVPKEKLYVIGNKNFGESNGIIYAKRSTEGYFQQKVKMPEGLMKQNLKESEKYGDHYINLMSLVSDENGMVRVFTDDNKFISQDCRHLTRAGAQYFSRILDIEAILQR